jgi:hypothetical protein
VAARNPILVASPGTEQPPIMAKKKAAAAAAPVADIARAILVLHRQRVILDAGPR